MSPKTCIFYAQDENWKGCPVCGWHGINCDCPHHAPLPAPPKRSILLSVWYCLNWPLILVIISCIVFWCTLFHFVIRALRGM